MSTHTPTSPVTATEPVTPSPRTPARSHRVAGTAAWILGTLTTALSTSMVVDTVYTALVRWPPFGAGLRGAVLPILSMGYLLVGTLWLVFLIAFAPLWRNHAVTRLAVWSAVVVGIAAGLLRFFSWI
jgi:hypothetical protein